MKFRGGMLNAERFQEDSEVKRTEKQGDMKVLTKMKCTLCIKKPHDLATQVKIIVRDSRTHMI